MPKYIDIETWPRRELFDFFIDYKNPYFNVCTKLDVTELLTMVRDRPDVRVSSAIHYFALRAANEVEQFRYRLQDGKIVVYDVINGGTTVLLPNESFAYAYFDYDIDFEKFVAGMNKSVDEIKNDDGPLKANHARRRHLSHDVAVDLIYQFRACAHSGPWRFGTEICLWKIY